MRVIPKSTLLPANVTSNVPEFDDVPTYNAATTYLIYEVMTPTTPAHGVATPVYMSRMSGNTGNPYTDTDWWMLLDAVVYRPYNSGVSYALGAIVSSMDWTESSLYQSLSAGNLANPLTDDVNWLKIGSTNRWAMFDDKSGSQTVMNETVDVTLTGVAGEIALLDIEGSSVDITITDPTEGVVYHENISLETGARIIDGYAYFHDPIITNDTVVLLDLPHYYSAEIRIVVSNSGTVAKLGSIVIGLQQDIGRTQYGLSVGIIDYSKKEVDTFGNYSILVRGYSKTMSGDVAIANDQFDRVFQLIAGLRATPAVWVGVETDFSSTVLYGFPKNFEETIKYVDETICNFTIEGIT